MNIIYFIKDNQWAIPIIIFVISSIAGIYKFIKETSQKQNITNFNQAKNLFCGDGLIELKKSPCFIQDMACKTVSYFKNHNFKEIEILVDSNLSLYEMINILRLKRGRILILDEKTGELKLANKYKDNISTKNFQIFSWIGFIIYVLFLLYIIIKYLPPNDIKTNLFITFAIGIVEIPMLLKIDKRKSIEKFKIEQEKILSELKFKKFLN